jgi:hypothetical protein
VLDVRASKSRPEMGLAKMSFEVLDDSDAIIMTLVTTFMLGRREAGP